MWAGVTGRLPRLRLPPVPQARPAEVPARRLGRGAVPRGAGEGVPATARCRTARRRTRSRAHRDHVGLDRAGRRRYAVGAATRAGRTSGTAAGRIADLRRRYGRGRVRHHRPAAAGRPRRPAGPRRTRLDRGAGRPRTCRSTSSPFQRGTIACTGIEFCKLAIVETKARAEAIRPNWSGGCPTSTTPITINVNGCPNSCARFQVADIGFKGIGRARRRRRGREAFQVHLGGQLGAEAAFGRKFRGLKVEADGAAGLRRAGAARLPGAPRPRRDVRRVRGRADEAVVAVRRA